MKNKSLSGAECCRVEEGAARSLQLLQRRRRPETQRLAQSLLFDYLSSVESLPFSHLTLNPARVLLLLRKLRVE